MNDSTPRLLIAFHDLELGGIQKKVIDICTYIQTNHPNIPIRISLRRRQGIFLSQVPRGIIISAPHRPIYRLGTIRFFLWMVKEILIFRPTHILSFMDFSAIPAITASKVFFWRKIKITIGEDILTSKYLTDLYGSKALIHQKLIERYYPRAAYILVQTPVQKNDLEHILHTQNNSKIISTPNWLPLDYPPLPFTALVKAGSRDIDILYLGRVAAQKNLTLFVKIIHNIARSNPKIIAYIVGSGEEDQKISQLIKKYRLQKNIKRVPQISNPQQYYLRAKNFLLTSDYEGFPLTIMEAISCGCRPISTDLPEIHQFFNKNPNDYLYNDINSAIKLIKHTPPSLPYYQKKVSSLQQKHISQYIKYCLH